MNIVWVNVEHVFWNSFISLGLNCCQLSCGMFCSLVVKKENCTTNFHKILLTNPEFLLGQVYIPNPQQFNDKPTKMGKFSVEYFVNVVMGLT